MKLSKNNTSRQYEHLFVAIATILSITSYFKLVLSYSINIPFSDDFNLFFTYINAPTNNKLHLLFSQHNEHRLAFSRFIAELMKQLLGYIDFRYLNIIGNVGLLIIFFLVLKIFKKTRVYLIYFVPIPFLLFNSFSWTNMVWATASLQNYYVLVFSLLSLLFFDKATVSSVALSILFASLATYTSGSGLLLFPIILLWALLRLLKKTSQKNIEQDIFILQKPSYSILFIVIAATVIIFFTYFFNYTKPGHHPSLITAIQNPSQALGYLLLFLGSYLQMKYIAFVGGVFSLVSFLYLTYRQYYRKNALIYFLLLFLFANALTATITRAGFGIEEALAARYAIISALILVFIYVSLLDIHISSIASTFAHKLLIAVVITTFAFSTLTMLRHIPDMEYRKHTLISSMEQWRNSKTGLLFSDQQLGSTLLETALDKGFYHFP